jgi:hypothetical protein
MLRILVIGATGRFSGIVDQLLARAYRARDDARPLVPCGASSGCGRCGDCAWRLG